MTDTLVAYAATIAPKIDAVRLALLAAAGPALGPLAAKTGLSQDASMVASMLRNVADDTVAAADLAELYVYQSPSYTSDALDELRSLGFVTGNDVIALTEKGQASIADVMAVLTAAARGRWPAPPADLGPALDAARRAVAHAATSGGTTFRVVTPVRVTPGMPPLTEFLETLTPLRFHRFDAHVMAWREEGLVAADLPQLDDALRERIEARTNELASAAFAGLTDDERAVFLAVLTELEP